MFEPVVRPLRVRLLNRADQLLRVVGVRRHRFDPERIKADAARTIGLTDYGDPDFEEGLRRWCENAEDCGLDIVGRAVVEAAMRRILGNRLLWVEHRKAHPEVYEAPLRSPVFVVGLPRTGTTALHRLLSHDPMSYAPPTWQVWRPLPKPGDGTDRRREVCVRAIEGLRQLAPQLDKKHYLDADATEECWHLRDPGFCGPGPYTLSPVWDYYMWQMAQDAGPSYQIYRDYLQIFQSEQPDRRLTMKAPSHAPQVADLEAAVPEGKLVQTHRDPRQVLGSMTSLAYTMVATVAPKVDPHVIGQNSKRLLTDYLRGNLEQRERLKGTIVDVRYADFVSDPVGTVRRIYEAHDLPWDDTVEAALKDGAGRRPQNKHGKHTWDLADYGLSDADVDEVFGDYAARFVDA